MDMGLTERVAIVTGASRGLGAATARALADEGMKVVIAARSLDELEVLARERPESFHARGDTATHGLPRDAIR